MKEKFKFNEPAVEKSAEIGRREIRGVDTDEFELQPANMHSKQSFNIKSIKTISESVGPMLIHGSAEEIKPNILKINDKKSAGLAGAIDKGLASKDIEKVSPQEIKPEDAYIKGRLSEDIDKAREAKRKKEDVNRSFA